MTFVLFCGVLWWAVEPALLEIVDYNPEAVTIEQSILRGVKPLNGDQGAFGPIPEAVVINPHQGMSGAVVVKYHPPDERGVQDEPQ